MLVVDTPPASKMATEPLPPEATVELLDRARRGDASALERLLDRCMPSLCRWAHGRLPGPLRGAHETVDLVQNAMMATLARLDGFEVRHQGALQAYLRQAVMNRIRDHVRRVGRRPVAAALDSQHEGSEPSPLEQAIGRETVERYEAALARLSDTDRELIVASVELGYTPEQVAGATGRASADAARRAARRALVKLAEEMGRG